jgi:hypothetical protein
MLLKVQSNSAAPASNPDLVCVPFYLLGRSFDQLMAPVSNPDPDRVPFYPTGRSSNHLMAPVSNPDPVYVPFYPIGRSSNQLIAPVSNPDPVCVPFYPIAACSCDQLIFVPDQLTAAGSSLACRLCYTDNAVHFSPTVHNYTRLRSMSIRLLSHPASHLVRRTDHILLKANLHLATSLILALCHFFFLV